MAVPISNVTRRQVYAPSGAGGAGPYAFTFEILANTDIAVYKDDVLLTLTTHYTVVINANGTGSVTITAAGLALAPASPTQYAIVGNRTIARTSDFTTGGDFFANTLNDELDQQTIFAQQNAEGLQRALAAPQTDPTSINMTLPRASLRANKALGFDASGNPVISDTLGTNRGNWAAGVLYYVRDIVKDTTNNNIWQVITQHTSSGSQPINTNVDAAKWTLLVDAASATTSATNAAASASAASTSASNASTSASNASTSASNASTSASNAASSASAASTSASNAAASYDSFDDRYLGPKATAPTLDNDGNALLTGALYWDTVANTMEVWSGSAWVDVNASASNTRTAITATASQTVLTVATYTPGTNTMVVYVNGVKLNASEYTETNANTVTLTTGLALNDEVEVFSYQVNAVGSLGASSVTFMQASANATTRNLQAKQEEFVSVHDFGAIGDGTTNDRSAFQYAFAHSNCVRLAAGKTYNLGNVTSNSAVFSFSGSNKIIDFNGAKVTVTTSGGNYNAPLFSLNNLDGFTLINPVIEDLGFDQTQTWKGITVVNFDPTTGKVRNVRVTGAKYTGVVSAFGVTSAAYNAENIWFEGDIYNCYYGINLAQNGHNLTADYRTYNAVRSYFCYGVRNHEIVCVSTAHAAAGNADFLIKCREAAHPTKSIRARFVSVGSLSTTNPQLVFESQNDSGDASIEDCWIHYDDSQSPLAGQSIAFRHYSDAGVLQATDPNTKARIKVVGRARTTISYDSIPTSQQDQNLDDCLGLKPSFLALLTTPIYDVTGNGVEVAPIVFNFESLDLAGNYNPATGIFTAPRDGVYCFHAQALVIDKTSSMTRADFKLVTSPRTFNNTQTQTVPSYPEQILQISVPYLYLKTGQTAKVHLVIYNGTGTADIFGDSPTGYTYFSGGLIHGGPKST